MYIERADRSFWIGAKPGGEANGWQLVVFEVGAPEGARAVLREGESLEIGNLSLGFVNLTGVPSVDIAGLPGVSETAVAEMSDGPGGKILTLGPIDGVALVLGQVEPVAVGDYEYTFLGGREFAGITVRRDPGSTFIWIATGLLLLGLALTFYTPRRRLWGRLEAGRAAFRGLGGRRFAIEKEIRQIERRMQGTE